MNTKVRKHNLRSLKNKMNVVVAIIVQASVVAATIARTMQR